MAKLLAKKPRYKYKTEQGYLRSVYYNNRDKIDAYIDDFRTETQGGKRYTNLKIFMARVREMQHDQYLKSKHGGDVTLSQAISGLARSESFTPVGERLRNNALSAIKQDKEAFAAIRKQLGWKTKITAENMEWSTKDKGYFIYTDKGTAFVDMSNSPKGIRVRFYGK